MADYTHLNLLELDETVSDRVATIEGRFGRTSLGTEHIGLTHWRYAPNHHSVSGHRHREQEEIYVVVAGSGRMRLDDEVIEVKPWDAVRVAPATLRALEAGPDGLEFLAIGSDRPEGGDGEQVQDFWLAD
jgi:uncharacterized cupin superfamily protein